MSSTGFRVRFAEMIPSSSLSIAVRWKSPILTFLDKLNLLFMLFAYGISILLNRALFFGTMRISASLYIHYQTELMLVNTYTFCIPQMSIHIKSFDNKIRTMYTLSTIVNLLAQWGNNRVLVYFRLFCVFCFFIWVICKLIRPHNAFILSSRVYIEFSLCLIDIGNGWARKLVLESIIDNSQATLNFNQSRYIYFVSVLALNTE